MVKIVKIIKKKITIGVILTILLSFICAAFFRFMFEYATGLAPLKGGIEYIDLYFFFLMALFRFILVVLLEYFLEDIYSIPIFGLANTEGPQSFPCQETKKNKFEDVPGHKTILSMVNKDESLASSSKDSSSQGNTVTTNSKTPTKMLDIDQVLDLRNKFRETLDTKADMVKGLRNLKISKDLNYHVDEKGGLDLSAPSNISDKELKEIVTKVGIMDRIYNTKSAEYSKLEGKDLMSNNCSLSKSYSNYNKLIKEQYNDLFDKE